MVKASRDLRLESEARAATERLLAEQRERELAARRALVRARQVATVCVLLALGAVVAAGFAYVSSQRAHRAEQLAEQARSGAEHLLGYLTDDFVRELESFGRLNVVAEFSKRQIDYFHALPPALKGPETTRNGALAMIHYARAERILGDIKAATANATEAGKLLEQLRAQGDQSEATTIALALGYATQAVILDNQNDPTGPVAGQRAADLLRPLAAAPGASVAVRRAFVEVLVRRGYEELNGLQNADAIRTEEQAMQLATGLGARDLSNLEMGAYYVEAGAWLVPALVNMGRNVEARRRGEDAVALADRVLEQRPGYRLALHGQQVIESSLSNVAQNELDPMEAYRLGLRTEQTSLSILKLDPDNIVTINNLGVAHQTLGDSLWGAGKLGAAIPYYLKSLDDYGHATVGGAGFSIIRAYDVAATAYRQAQLGDAAGAAATIASGAPFLARLRQKDPQASVALAIVDALGKMSSAGATLERDEFAATGRFASAASDQLRAITPNGSLEVSQRSISLFFSQHLAGRAAFQTGDYAAAEAAEREALAARKVWGTEAIPDQRDIGEVSTWLAMALARQGKTKEAAQLIGPVVKFQRGLAARNRSDQWLPVELASALYAQALTDPKQRTALLQEAATLLGAVPATLRNLHDVRQWRNLIAAARGAG